MKNGQRWVGAQTFGQKQFNPFFLRHFVPVPSGWTGTLNLITNRIKFKLFHFLVLLSLRKQVSLFRGLSVSRF
jgi:hypothetical protein